MPVINGFFRPGERKSVKRGEMGCEMEGFSSFLEFFPFLDEKKRKIICNAFDKSTTKGLSNFQRVEELMFSGYK